MNKKNVVIGVIGAMILIAIIFALISLMSSKISSKDLIYHTIQLRTNYDDPIERAKSITTLNTIVSDLNSKSVNEGWRGLAACIPEGCTDDDYMNFIISATNDKPRDIEYSDIIKELVKVHRFWGDTNNVIVFSQSLTNANTMINDMHFSTAINVWNDVVACNGECEEFDNLFFELIGVIVDL